MIENVKEREQLIHILGEKLARQMPDFYGHVKINLQSGKYVNANIEQSIKPTNET